MFSRLHALGIEGAILLTLVSPFYLWCIITMQCILEKGRVYNNHKKGLVIANAYKGLAVHPP